jgi:hypothetical protein
MHHLTTCLQALTDTSKIIRRKEEKLSLLTFVIAMLKVLCGEP